MNATRFDMSLCAGMGLGAGLMYFLDPEVGRRRRALCRDQLVRATHQIEAGIEKALKDARNRAQGLAAETSAIRWGRLLTSLTLLMPAFSLPSAPPTFTS